jgi:hypothetical protein
MQEKLTCAKESVIHDRGELKQNDIHKNKDKSQTNPSRPPKTGRKVSHQFKTCLAIE